MSEYIEFAIKHWDLFAALAIIIFMMFSGGLTSRLRGFTEISAAEAVNLINHQNAAMLDVREDKEFQEGHILDAIHIPLGKLAGRLGELEALKSQPLVISCRSGHRSATACTQLRKQGFETIYNLKGGVMAWQSAGLPLQKPGKKKKRK
jgi:rhodanese-related sulfurtransferase